jgi:hypothetical protein
MIAMHTLVAALLAITLQQGPDSVVAYARRALEPLPDTAALKKAGFGAIGFGGSVKDLSPFQGQHWLAVRQFLMNEPMTLAKPTIVMYLPVRDSMIPIGVAYTKRVAANTPSPTDIGGIPAEWHVHIICRGIPGEGQVLANGVEDCLTRGGDPGPNQITMVHAWTVPNPDGPYAHDNPALPFLALGLKPPAQFMRDERLFAIALGEAYGARLTTAAYIERYVATSGRETKLATHRATMRGLARELLAAEGKGDAKQYEAVRTRVLATWATIVDEYHAIAPTPQIRQRFDIELEQLLGSAHHHG